MPNEETNKEAAKQEKTEQCSYCKQEFVVARYGWGIPCPHCQNPLTILPDPKIFLYVDGKAVGVAIAEGGEETLLAIFSKFSTQILARAKLL